MRIAVLSDAHANHIGLDACLDHIRREESVDAIYFLGDAVGYFSEPNAVVNALRRSKAICLRGNHDAMVLEQISTDASKESVYQIDAARRALTVQNVEFLSETRLSLVQHVGTKRVMFLHGSPHNELEGYIYPDSDLDPFYQLSYDAIFVGHTHHPFRNERDGKWIVNAGSCGLPRDHGSLASFAIYDSEVENVQEQVEIVRVPLNVVKIVAHFSASVHKDVLSVLDRRPAVLTGRLVDLDR